MCASEGRASPNPLSSHSHYKQEWISQPPPCWDSEWMRMGKMTEAARLPHYLNNRPGNSISTSLIRPHQLPQLSCTSWRLPGWLLLVTDESRRGSAVPPCIPDIAEVKALCVCARESVTGGFVWRSIISADEYH